jgi:hypothetical protein
MTDSTPAQAGIAGLGGRWGSRLRLASRFEVIICAVLALRLKERGTDERK